MNYFIKIILIFSIIFYNCNNPPSKTKHWKPLFNGKNLNGWIVKINGYKLNENYNNTFRVENNLLKVSYDKYKKFSNEYGHLFYKTPFTNYKLRLKYRFIGNQISGGQSWAKKNSGIMIHCQDPKTMLINQEFPLSLEVQLLGGLHKGENRPTGNLCTPSTYVYINNTKETAHCLYSKSKTYYGAEWIEALVVVTKDSITHFIDEKPVLSYTNPTIGGDFLNTTSREIQKKTGHILTNGYISLQSESHPIEFKSIEILEL